MQISRRTRDEAQHIVGRRLPLQRLGKFAPCQLLYGVAIGHLWHRSPVALITAGSVRDSIADWPASSHGLPQCGISARLMTAVGRVSRVSPVQTAMRNCTRDEGRSFEAGSQVLASNRCKLLSSKAMVVSVAVNVGRIFGRSPSPKIRKQATRNNAADSTP